ncbi:hypothetical protein ACFE04_026775 [Oxalis oulophora]
MPPYFCLTLTVASKSLRPDDLVSSWATASAKIHSRLKKYAIKRAGRMTFLTCLSFLDFTGFTDHEDVFSRISLALFTHGKIKVFTRKASYGFHLVKGKIKRFELEESNTDREKWKPQYATSVWFSFDDSDGKGKTKVFTRKASHGFIPLR